MKEKVSIIRCPDYGEKSVTRGVKKAVELAGGLNKFVRPGERILLKPNLLSAKPPEAAVTTHPSVLRAVIRLVSEAGATPVVGDSPAIGSAVKVAGRSGVLTVCREEGVEFMELDDPVTLENPDGHTFKRLEISRKALEVDGIINIPKLKTHAQVLLTLGVKNIFGCVPGKLKPQWHLSAGVDTDYFAGMILDLYLFLKPRLTVMDGIVGMEGNGPGNGTPRELGLIFAAGNAIAMDAVIASVLGANPEDLPILKAAQRRGIEAAELNRVAVKGETIDAVSVEGFDLPPLIHTNFTERLPYFIGRRLRKAITSRPHVSHSDCTLCNVCVGVCPAGIMQSMDRINIDYDSCIRCYCCQEMCPHGAISSREGWLKKIIPGL